MSDRIDLAKQQVADSLEELTRAIIAGSSVTPPDPPDNPDPGTGGGGGNGTKPFLLFDALRWGGKPDLVGFEPVKFWYAAEFFDPVPDREDQNFALPKPGVIESVAKRAHNGLNVKDVEHMWPGNGYAMDPRAIDAHVEMTKRWQGSAKPGSKMAWYSGIPRNFHQATDDKSSAGYKRWRSDVDKSIPIIRLCDALTLSLYTFYEDRDGHELYMRRNIEAGLEVADGLPVYAVLWPLYHDSNKEGRKYDQIEGAYWRQQLEVCKDAGLDGAIIWTRSKERNIPWSQIGDWWEQTEDFKSKLLAA